MSPPEPSLADAPPPFAPEALLVQVAETQDKAAFCRLFEYYAPRLKGYLARSGVSAAQAEELAQETMLTVWRNARAFDANRGAAATWIFTIARNLRIDVLRRRRTAAAAAVREDVLPDNPAPDALVSVAEIEARVRDILPQLPSDQLAVVRLSFFHDRSHAQIAQELGLPLGTVKSRLRLAFERLRGLLSDFQ